MIKNSSNTKFHENLSGEGQVVTYGEANMTKLIIVSRILRTGLKINGAK
jgi:hypothetical protein